MKEKTFFTPQTVSRSIKRKAAINFEEVTNTNSSLDVALLLQLRHTAVSGRSKVVSYDMLSGSFAILTW